MKINFLKIDTTNHDTQTIKDSLLYSFMFSETNNKTLTDNTTAKLTGFTAKLGQISPGIHSQLKDTICMNVGLGNESLFTPDKARLVGCLIAQSVQTKTAITLNLLEVPNALEILEGFYLRYWNFTKYRTNTAADHKLHLETLNILADESTQTAFAALLPVLQANHWVRNICEEPANVCNSAYMEEQAKSLEKVHPKIKVKVLNQKELEALNMNALLGVNQGSANPPKLLVVEYFNESATNNEGKTNPYVFVGKAVTFDTGGISIKPSADMDKMKKDMSGGATVLGLIKAIASNNLAVNAVAIVPVVENMPSGTAQRPGDVWKTANGQTIEVLNTDAEGRLILCDALWYAQEYYTPEYILDFATLTGAILIALGSTYAGAYTRHTSLFNSLSASGEKTGELLWRMPLHKDYDQDVNSAIADIANLGQSTPYAGSNTAAAFLARFVKPEIKWAHLDIAGTAYTKRNNAFYAGVGSTGYGVRLVYNWLTTANTK